jgi:hypothetical protein
MKGSSSPCRTTRSSADQTSRLTNDDRRTASLKAASRFSAQRRAGRAVNVRDSTASVSLRQRRMCSASSWASRSSSESTYAPEATWSILINRSTVLTKPAEAVNAPHNLGAGKVDRRRDRHDDGEPLQDARTARQQGHLGLMEVASRP